LSGTQGSRETVDRAEAGKALAAKFGGTPREIYWTVGPYDNVAITQAFDDESATAFALSLAAQCNALTTTLRAFSGDEVRSITR
jgi:uncharacterized protein with GYD domain